MRYSSKDLEKKTRESCVYSDKRFPDRGSTTGIGPAIEQLASMQSDWGGVAEGEA